MTAGGDAALAVSYTQVGVTEDPPNSNNVPYDDEWGFNSAWCATFVSWCCTQAGVPVPPINGPAGFSYCPDGQVSAFTTGHDVDINNVEPGDILIFSWEPFYYGSDGVAYCSYGVYAGAAAGDHTGFFSYWLSDGYMVTVEGNTSQSSWDNGGAVMERSDRYTGQICCYARHAALGSSTPPPVVVEPVRPKDDSMIMRSATGAVFVVSAEGKRNISQEEWQAWTAAGHPTVDISTDLMWNIPDVQRTVIRDPNTGAMFVVGESGKRPMNEHELSWRSPNTRQEAWDGPAGWINDLT